MKTPIKIAVSIIGGTGKTGKLRPGKTAKLLGIASPTVSQWLSGIKRMPAKYAPKIEAASGVRCEDLCPGVKFNRDKKGRAISFTTIFGKPNV